MNSALFALLAVPLFAVPPLPKLDKYDTLADEAAFQKGSRSKAPAGATAGQTPIARYKIPVADEEFLNRKVTSYPLGPATSPKPVWFGFVGAAGFKTRHIMLSGEGVGPVFIPLPGIAALTWNMTLGGGMPIDVPGLGRYVLSVSNLASLDLAKIEISLTSKDKSLIGHAGLKAAELMRGIGVAMKPRLFTFDALGQPVALLYSKDVDASGARFENTGTYLFLREKTGGAYDAWAFAEGEQPFTEGAPEDLTLEAPNLPTVSLRVEQRGGELLVFSR